MQNQWDKTDGAHEEKRGILGKLNIKYEGKGIGNDERVSFRQEEVMGIRSKNLNRKRYLDAVRVNDLYRL